MLSNLFTSVADALLSYAIDKLDPAERIKSWLRLEPARLVFEKALARAYSAFARQYPEYTSSLFDQSFLSTNALPELSKLLTRNQHPDPALLAQTWGQSIGTGADFAQRATKPAAYFLERLEAELKTEPALQAVFDSRALERLPKIEADIQKLAKELQRGLDEALNLASNYQKATVHIRGDVQDSVIITGNNNQLTINKYFYSGDFVSLDEYYIPPDGVFQRVRVDELVGRDWLTAKVDAFLNDPNLKSGAFLLIGDAGVGKTAFMAHLVKERRYLHLFAEQAPGQAMLQRAMQSLASQLVTRYQIDPYKDRDTLNALSVFPDFLERILRLAASTLTEGEKIVIVCDALDEAGTFPDHFVFGLPKELPDSVYFILSQRPVNVKLPNFEPVIENLEAQGEDNLQDIEAYLSAVAKRPEIAGQIRSKEYSEEFFIQTLKEKSQGVWMYLHYIIKEIESGARAPLDLGNLPTGLVGYYAEYWDAWRTGKRGKGEEAWDELYAPLLTTLAAAQEAISVDWLIQWADVTAKPREVTRLLTEHWRAFITEKEKDGQKTYIPYHLSFKEFITGRVDTTKLPPAQANLIKELAEQTVDAHKRIVDVFEKECKGEWEKLVEQAYPRLHLTAHLNGAGEYEKLRILLTEGDEKIKWAEAREQKEETYAGYLNDLTYVWEYAEQKQNYTLTIRCMLIENSVHSLASIIPPELLAELGKSGIWSYERCLSMIRQNPHSSEQAKALELLAPKIPPLLFQKTLDIACEIKNESDCASAISTLAPYLGKDINLHAFFFALKMQGEVARAYALSTLAPHLTDEIKPQAFQDALTATREIQSEDRRANALFILAPHLSDEFKVQVLQEASTATQNALDFLYKNRPISGGPRQLANIVPYLINEQKKQLLIYIREIQDDIFRVVCLKILLPHLNDELKTQAIQEALDATQKIKNIYYHAISLSGLMPHINDEFKIQILQSLLFATRELQIESNRADVLFVLVPHLNDELKIQALTIAREINEESVRARALSSIAPYLSNDLKFQVLHEALAAAQEIKSKSACVSALSVFLPYLSDKLKAHVTQEALATAREIQDGTSRAHALSSVAPYLTDDFKIQVLQESLSAICETKDESIRARALSNLVPYLINNNLKSQVLTALCEIKYEWYRANVLLDLAPYLTDELKPQALIIAREIKDKSACARALSALVPHLTVELRLRALQDALAASHEIKTEYHRANVLSALAPHLNDELKIQALTAAREINEESVRARVLASFTPYLKDKLKDSVLQDAFAAVCEIKTEQLRADALVDIMPYLNDKFKDIALQDALAIGLEIKDKHSRSRTLANLVPYFNETMQILILQEVLYFAENHIFNMTLTMWKEIEFKGLKEHIIPFIKFTSQKERKDGVEILAALTPALVHFRGPEIVPELYRTITDVTRWWP
ncbi:MAG: AAA family ATPase [Chloroflexota bacterium]